MYGKPLQSNYGVYKTYDRINFFNKPWVRCPEPLGIIRIQDIPMWCLRVFEVLFSPSTAFTREPPARWTMVVMKLLDERSPALFLSRFTIYDDIDIRRVTTLPLVFPPLFVGI